MKWKAGTETIFRGYSIQVSDKSVLDGFVKSQTGRALWDRMEFSSTHSISDAANIFYLQQIIQMLNGL